METAVQPRSLKLTFKLKREDGLSNCSVTADHVNNAAGESDALNNSPLSGGPVNAAEDQEELLSSPEVIENVSTEGVENPAPESAQNQLVLYDPAANGGELINPEPISSLAPLSRQHPFSNQTPRVLPSVGAFTVQCAECFKWRLIPTKEKYEEIREHIIEQPFMCEKAREWKPDISCEDPPDIEQDGSRLWAIDGPNIAQPPRGWQRLLRIRGEGSTKFADVYYVSPSGKRLRSMVEVQKYLAEYPSYVEHGVSLSQFSFQIPRPLQANYVRKRPLRATPPIDTDGHGTPGSLSQVEPIQWEADTELQLGTPGLSPQNFDSPATPEVQSAKKKKKTSSKKKYDGDVIYNQNELNMGGSSQL